MSKIIIADIVYTNSDETYYVGTGRHYQEEYAYNTLEETTNNLLEKGFHESFKIDRSDGVFVNTWCLGDFRIAIWDNDIQPYKER